LRAAPSESKDRLGRGQRGRRKERVILDQSPLLSRRRDACQSLFVSLSRRQRLFYSRTGVAEALAEAIVEGVERQGAEVRLRRAEFVSPEEIMAKATGRAEAAEGKLNGKAGAVFCSTSTAHGGLLSMYNLLAHLGFIIVPTGYADASLYKAGTPYGASSVSNNQARPPSDLGVARFQGRRVTDVAKAFKHSGVK
jgi:NAD(P)H dehydrogenase (quinone)